MKTGLGSPHRKQPLLTSAHQLEKVHVQHQRTNAAKKKKRIETGTIGIENKLWHIVVLFLLLMQALIEV